MKEKIWTIIGGVGFFMILAGGCALDSECMTMPVMMVAAGLILAFLSSRVILIEE